MERSKISGFFAPTMEVAKDTTNDTFEPSQNCLALFQKYSNITDVEILKSKVVIAQEKALKTFAYVCLRNYWFSEPNAPSHPYYPTLLQENHPNRRILDLGCCMGTDVRNFIVDGAASKENVIGYELERSFVDIGFDLFEDAEKLGDNFFIGDSLRDEGVGLPDASFDVVYCSAVYHLLNKDQGARLTKNVFRVLKGKTETNSNGGIFFGRTGGSGDAEPFEMPDERNGILRYMHTTQSLKGLLESVGFENVVVEQGNRSGRLARDNNRDNGVNRIMLNFTGFKTH